MRRISSFLLAAGIVTLGQSAWAKSSAADTLDYFVGDWHCHVAQDGGELDPHGFSTASTERLRGDWFVTWILAFHDNTSDKMVAKMRYDEARQRYVLFLADDRGSYGHGFASDWQDDALVFKGKLHDVSGEDIAFEKTFKKISGGKFSLAWSAETASLRTSDPELICER